MDYIAIYISLGVFTFIASVFYDWYSGIDITLNIILQSLPFILAWPIIAIALVLDIITKTSKRVLVFKGRKQNNQKETL